MSGRGQGVGPGPREEEKSAPRDRPHVTENDRGAPVQRQAQAPHAVPVMPANAHGHDQQTTHDQPRDDASMYDGRPGEDKDKEPGDLP